MPFGRTGYVYYPHVGLFMLISVNRIVSYNAIFVEVTELNVTSFSLLTGSCEYLKIMII